MIDGYDNDTSSKETLFQSKIVIVTVLCMCGCYTVSVYSFMHSIVFKHGGQLNQLEQNIEHLYTNCTCAMLKIDIQQLTKKRI